MVLVFRFILAKDSLIDRSDLESIYGGAEATVPSIKAWPWEGFGAV